MTAERERFLRDWYRLMKQHESSSDPIIRYAIDLTGPIMDEVLEKAAKGAGEKPTTTKTTLRLVDENGSS